MSVIQLHIGTFFLSKRFKKAIPRRSSSEIHLSQTRYIRDPRHRSGLRFSKFERGVFLAEPMCLAYWFSKCPGILFADILSKFQRKKVVLPFALVNRGLTESATFDRKVCDPCSGSQTMYLVLCVLLVMDNAPVVFVAKVSH